MKTLTMIAAALLLAGCATGYRYSNGYYRGEAEYRAAPPAYGYGGYGGYDPYRSYAPYYYYGSAYYGWGGVGRVRRDDRDDHHHDHGDHHHGHHHHGRRQRDEPRQARRVPAPRRKTGHPLIDQRGHVDRHDRRVHGH